MKKETNYIPKESFDIFEKIVTFWSHADPLSAKARNSVLNLQKKLDWRK